MKNKGQFQMMESVMFLVIFIILAAFLVVLYFTFSISSSRLELINIYIPTPIKNSPKIIEMIISSKPFDVISPTIKRYIPKSPLTIPLTIPGRFMQYEMPKTIKLFLILKTFK